MQSKQIIMPTVSPGTIREKCEKLCSHFFARNVKIIPGHDHIKFEKDGIIYIVYCTKE